MPKYAQIDLESGKCVAISHLSGEVNADHMIPLTDEDNVKLGYIYGGGEWEAVEIEETVTQSTDIAQLVKDEVKAALAALGINLPEE